MNKAEIKKLLIDKNLTQIGMARDLGMTRQNLHRILCGKAKTEKHYRRISQYLGVAEETLFPDDEEHKECQT